MKQQIKAEQMVGKTILRVEHYFGEIIIIFEDSFCSFKAEGGYDNSLEISDDKLNERDIYTNLFVEYGIITQEEYDTYHRNKIAEQTRKREEQERAEFERLKSKYGKEQTP